MVEVYILTSKSGKFKYLCIDERERNTNNSRKLPKLKSGLAREKLRDDVKKLIEDVCMEITNMKYVKGMSWSAVADAYGVSKKTLVGYYIRHCK